MEFICFCCLVGAIIYGCSSHNRVNYIRRRNARGLANAPVAQQTDRLRGTAHYSRQTGPVIYYANDNHNQSDREYRFNYRYVGNSWRAYIVRKPNLNNAERGAQLHMLRDNGSYYICWSGNVNSLHDIQVISKQWADNYQEYLATGNYF